MKKLVYTMNKNIIKISSILLLFAMLWQDILFAHPALTQEACPKNTLQILSRLEFSDPTQRVDHCLRWALESRKNLETIKQTHLRLEIAGVGMNFAPRNGDIVVVKGDYDGGEYEASITLIDGVPPHALHITIKWPGAERESAKTGVAQQPEVVSNTLKSWHDAYLTYISEARKLWLEANPGRTDTEMLKLSLRLPPGVKDRIGPSSVNIEMSDDGASANIILNGNTYQASADNPLDLAKLQLPFAERISMLISLPDSAKPYFKWWPEGINSLFDILVERGQIMSPEVSADAEEVASMYLRIEGDMICVEQFIVNPGFRLTGAGKEFLRNAIDIIRRESESSVERIRFNYLAEGARAWLEYLEKIDFITCPLVDKEGTYWFLGAALGGKGPVHKVESEKISDISAKILESMAPPSEAFTRDNALARLTDGMKDMADIFGLDRFALYLPFVDEVGNYITSPVDSEGLSHIQWEERIMMGMPWGSRYAKPHPFTGEKWISEQVARHYLSADEINKFNSGCAFFDEESHTWQINDRRVLINKMKPDPVCGSHISIDDVAQVENDITALGPPGNKITYQDIYAPTLKEGGEPRLLGVFWIIGDVNMQQLAAIKSFAVQAGHALERIYLLHSLAARTQEIDKAYLHKKTVAKYLSYLEKRVHIIKNQISRINCDLRLLLMRKKIQSIESLDERNAVEAEAVKMVKDLVKSVEELDNLFGEATPQGKRRTLMVFSNMNLAAALIMAADKAELDRANQYYINYGGEIETTKIGPMKEIAHKSFEALSELKTVTEDLELIRSKTDALLNDMKEKCIKFIAIVSKYMKLPLGQAENFKGDKSMGEDLYNTLTKQIPPPVKELAAAAVSEVTEEKSIDTELQALINSAIDEMRPALQSDGIHLLYHPPAKPVMVRIRPGAFKSDVIIEFLRNAIKYIPDEKQDKKVEISLSFPDDGYVDIHIKDNGIGMSEDFIERCFTRRAMAKIPEEMSTKISRSGIGLYVARQAMLDMGGDISINRDYTAPGVGTWFVVRCPLAASDAVKKELPASPDAAGQSEGPARDDAGASAGMAPILSRVLSKWGVPLKCQALIEQGIVAVFAACTVPFIGCIIPAASVLFGFITAHYMHYLFRIKHTIPHAPPYLPTVSFYAFFNALPIWLLASVPQLSIALFLLTTGIHHFLNLQTLDESRPLGRKLFFISHRLKNDMDIAAIRHPQLWRQLGFTNNESRRIAQAVTAVSNDDYVQSLIGDPWKAYEIAFLASLQIANPDATLKEVLLELGPTGTQSWTRNETIADGRTETGYKTLLLIEMDTVINEVMSNLTGNDAIPVFRAFETKDFWEGKGFLSEDAEYIAFIFLENIRRISLQHDHGAAVGIDQVINKVFDAIKSGEIPDLEERLSHKLPDAPTSSKRAFISRKEIKALEGIPDYVFQQLHELNSEALVNKVQKLADSLKNDAKELLIRGHIKKAKKALKTRAALLEHYAEIMNPNTRRGQEERFARTMHETDLQKAKPVTPRTLRLEQRRKGPEPYLQGMEKPEEVVSNIIGVTCSILNGGKKFKEPVPAGGKTLVLAYHKNIKGFRNGELRSLIAKLQELKNKDGFKILLKNLVIISSFTSDADFREQLKDHQVDPDDKDRNIIFTFAPKEEQGKFAISAQGDINPVFIEEQGEFDSPELYYHPLFEIVLISLVKYYRNLSAQDIKDNLKALAFDPKDLNIDDFTDDNTPFLLFKLIPKAQKHEIDIQVNRECRIREALEAQA